MWRQTDGSLEPILRTVQLRRSQPIRDALEKSIEENCQRAIPDPPRPELPLAALYDKLQHYLDVQYPQGSNEVRDDILRRCKKRLVDPLRTQAETTDDFRRAFFLLQLADLVERERAVALEITIPPRPNMKISPDTVDRLTNEQFKLVDRIMKLTEALRK
jgi:hypothetical protein